MHFLVLIVIPCATFLQGKQSILRYIEEKMAPYNENLQVPPYVETPKDKLQQEYEEFKASKQDIDVLKTFELFCDRQGYLLDENGNAISTVNENGLWDWFDIGGRFEGIFTGTHSDDGFKFVFSHTIRNNSISVRTLTNLLNQEEEINLFHPTIIDTNGVVTMFEEGKEESELQSEYKALFNSFNDNDYVVNVDCHS